MKGLLFLWCGFQHSSPSVQGVQKNATQRNPHNLYGLYHYHAPFHIEGEHINTVMYTNYNYYALVSTTHSNIEHF